MRAPIPKPGEEMSSVELRLVREGGVVRLEPAGVSGRLLAAVAVLGAVFLGFGLIPTLAAPGSPVGLRAVFFGISAAVWVGLAGVMLVGARRQRGLGPVGTFDEGARVVAAPRELRTFPAGEAAGVVLIKFRLHTRAGGHSHTTHARQAVLVVREAGDGERAIALAMNPWPRAVLRRFAEAAGVPFTEVDGGTHTHAAWNARRLEGA